MSVVCPNGHQSETDDYCDQCGARIGGAAAPAPSTGTAAPAAGDPASAGILITAPATVPPAPVPAPGPTPGAAGESHCPVCQTPRVGDDRFCEGCGHDYAAPTTTAGPAATVLASVSGTHSTSVWEATAIADRDYFDRVAPEGVPFPLHCPPRTFLLAGDQIRIGRHSNSRGIQPEVDLSGAPEDSAISHLHCILIEQADGSYSVVDPGSTNGTTVNDDPTPLMANISVALADGDRIHLGAWTTITIRARPPVEASTATP
ncbi:MAG: FHA domain-containing protein [Actinomycetota bacterium]|nr:FHA domain-containing protein [Actinomycetota bacterium]MDQ6947058.1 FHA domain-containing protein [Actinomycetota bacterium]